MPNFIVCQNKNTERLALIPEGEIDDKNWISNGQIIEADDWKDAREMVNESGMYKSPIGGDYFYVE